MVRAKPPHAQRGAILWLLLIFGLLAGSYAFYQQNRAHPERQTRDAALLATMAHARDALIARAVTDDNRPGSLPCPDLVTDSSGLANRPGDGKADMFTLTQCPSYVGWLPWVTLDLPEALDDSASRLWYAVSPSLRDDDSAQPINSDTATNLQLDGRGEVAALLIAPRAALEGQTRPSRRPADYLEGGNGNNLRFVSGTTDPAFNDLILPLTRRELMAAVEKRVAGEVRACLERHAAAPGNPDQRYPWPAPLGNTDFRGQSASRFGRIPLSQPAPGAQAALQASLAALDRTLATLDRASDAATRSSALGLLGEQLAATRNFADVLFAIVNRIHQASGASLGQLRGLDGAVAAAVANERISRSEGSLIRERSEATSAAIGELAEQLQQSGIDAFPARLRQLVAALDSATDSASRQAAIRASSDLLATAATPRSDLAIALGMAKIAANTASTASIDNATPAASELRHALSALDSALSASRANLLASDLEFHITALAGQLAAWQATPDKEMASSLQNALRNAGQTIGTLACGVPAVAQARDTAATAIATALAGSGANMATLENSEQAILELRRLVAALATNEAADGNLSRTSLAAAAVRFNAASGRFRQVDLASPRPLQKEIVPYADAVGDAAVDLALIAEMLTANATLVAPLAKAAAGSDPARTGVVDDSLWSVASEALNSLNGKNGSLSLQQAWLATPSSNNRDRAASALAETRRLAQTLLEVAQKLAQPLSTSTASALPIIWLSQRCEFLRTGTSSWWHANRWADSVFYQFSSPSAIYPGQLTVNGRSGYRLVALAAGRSLAGQQRNGPGPGVGDFLEGINADPSRNPPAAAPSAKFVSSPTSGQFNDQLAY